MAWLDNGYRPVQHKPTQTPFDLLDKQTISDIISYYWSLHQEMVYTGQKKPAETDDEAQLILGSLYLEDSPAPDMSIELNYDMALYWLEKSADNGNTQAFIASCKWLFTRNFAKKRRKT